MELMQIMGAAWLSKSVSVAARLGIADVLEEGPLTPEEIAARTDCDADAMLRLMRVLSACRIFRSEPDGRFANAEMSQLLRSGHPASLRHFCILAGEEYYEAWGALLHTIRTGQSGFVHEFGGSLYDHLERNADAAQVYDRAMEDLSRPVGGLLAQAFDFRPVRTLVDVGGGSGVLVREVMKLHADLRAIVVDREDVCRRAAACIGDEFGGRLTFQPGDFFVQVPAGADAYLLKNVLHNWNEESCARILGTVRNAMTASRPNGERAPRLFVIEPLVEPDDESPRKRVHALFQIVVCQDGTRERTEAQMRAMVADAGFAVTGTAALATGHTVLEAVAR
jgi:hypothetical protein